MYCVQFENNIFNKSLLWWNRSVLLDGYRQERRGWEVAFYVMTIIECMKFTVGNGTAESHW